MNYYTVKEMFWTIQGEGLNDGRAALFVRFAGCNLWNGRPDGRGDGRGACAQWCDTAFVGGERFYGSVALQARMLEVATAGVGPAFRPTYATPLLCVLTGGEPALQLDYDLLMHLVDTGWSVAIETNGTIKNDSLELADHVCVSPKAGARVALEKAHELKVILPGVGGGSGWTEADLEEMAKRGEWGSMFVQPQDPLLSAEVGDTLLHPIRSRQTSMHARGAYETNVARCVDFVKTHPKWRLSLQTHKFIGVR